MRKSAWFWLLVLVSLALLATPSQALAAGSTTGNISGKVTDEKGDPIPGVLVTAHNDDTGLERAVTTDARGEYMILGLPPATYVAQAKIEGYGAPPKSVVVNLGQTVPLNFQLKPGGGLEERVKVTAEPPLLNTTKSELSTVVTERDVRSYPLIQRDYNDLAQLAPGVKQAPSGQFDPTKKEQIYTPFTTGGTSGRNVNISIDGADNNDNVVGFFVQGFTTEAIQEFEVIQDQYKAEYGRSLGGVVNVITKSGTNDFGGSVFGYFFNENLRAKTFGESVNGEEKTQTDRQFFGFSVGGPIVKDKFFYFVALERQNDERPTALGSALTQFGSSEPAGYPFDIASSGTTVLDFERDLWTIKLNWNVTSNHLIWARWSRDNADVLNDQGGALSDPSNQGGSKNDIWSAVLSWQWNIGGNAINEMKIHRNDFENRIVSFSPDPILTLTYDQFDIGRNINTPQATFQNKFQFRDDFTWIRGRNTFKTGVEAIRVDVDDSFLGPATTTAVQFIFNSGVDPTTSMLAGEDPNIVISGVTDPNNGIDDGIEIINEVAPANPSFIPGTRYMQYGVYFQDDLEWSDKWRFHVGLRVDRDQDIFRDARKGINKEFYECFDDPDNAHKCGLDPNTPEPTETPALFNGFDNTFPEDQTNVSPRIGFIYRVNGEDRDVFRGSWGLFYDKLIDNLVIFMRQNLSPFFHPSLPTFPGCVPSGDPNVPPDCSGEMLSAGNTPVTGYASLPSDFTLANWVDPNTGLQAWVDGLTSIQGPATFDDLVILPSPDWKTPYTSAFSVGWGHTFNTRLTLDNNLIYRRGFHQLFREEWGGRTSGREAPFPVEVDPNTGVATYPGRVIFFTTAGKTEYISFQTSLKGRWPNFDFGINLNLSQALGTQDNAGTQPGGDTGPIDIFEGGNIQFTGGNINSEWGRISGDQAFYGFAYGIYRFQHGFQAAGNMVYGSKTAFQGACGTDCNGDGFRRREEYVGTRGGGLGDDLFNINLRGSKIWDTGKGTKIEGYLDIFNLLNRRNHGIFVIHQQLTASGQPNPDYGRPTTDTLTPPRTVQAGVRFTF